MTEPRHALLERQLRQATAADGTVDWERFAALVGAAERESERRSAGSTAAETVARFQVILDNMSQGLIMLDARLDVVAYNPLFRAMFDLPDALLRQRPRHAASEIPRRAAPGDDVDQEPAREGHQRLDPRPARAPPRRPARARDATQGRCLSQIAQGAI